MSTTPETDERLDAGPHSRALMQRGNVPPVTKEMVASAVSMINACEY